MPPLPPPNPAMTPEQRLAMAKNRQALLGSLAQLADASTPRPGGPGPLPPAGGPGPFAAAERRENLDNAIRSLKKTLESIRAAWTKAAAQGAHEAAKHTQAIGLILAALDKHPGSFQDDSDDQIEAFLEALRVPLAHYLRTCYPVEKILIAVHGIGDQFSFETIQSVAYRVCDYVGEPAAIPLGRFHGNSATITQAYLPDPDRDPRVNCGFAEIYWANVPRVPVEQRFTLEEPKKWARTLVERLELRAQQKAAYTPQQKLQARRDNELIEQVIEEMIQGVVVADRLAYLAEKAGLFKFSLKKILIDYLDDVQVVTEFENYRAELLRIFRTVMKTTNDFFPDAELYIVAHSEGTVVAFMGLLQGLSDYGSGAQKNGKPVAEWTTMVKGFMTIGSPLNKHVRLWPELFEQFKTPAHLPEGSEPIKWRNYYDYGDPIAYNLRQTREWMKKPEHNWSPFFEFESPDDDPATAKVGAVSHDIGFSRYFFPGAAHNDYWRDPGVFGHFLQTVVDPEKEVLPPEHNRRYEAPKTIRLAHFTSYTLPYVVASLLLFLGVYLLYKVVRACLDPIGAGMESSGEILRNVLGISGLLAGISLIARIPRLTRRLKYRLWTILGFALLFSYLLVSPENQASIASFVDRSNPWVDAAFATFLAVILVPLAITLWSRANRDLPPWLRTTGPVLLSLLPTFLLVFLIRLASRGLGRLNVVREDHFPVPGLVRNAASPWLDHVNFVGEDHFPMPLGFSLGVILVGGCVGIMASLVGRRFPRIGLKPLLHTSGLVLFMIVLAQVSRNRSQTIIPGKDGVVEALHSRIETLTKRLASYEEGLDQERTNLKSEVEGPQKAGSPPGDLAKMEDALSDDKRQAGLVHSLKQERAALDQELVKMARQRVPWKDLKDLANQRRKLDEKLSIQSWTEEDRRSIGDVASLKIMLDAAQVQGPIWPVVVGGFAFLYIWWLATLTFDLAFIWHIYIRNDSAQNCIEDRLRNDKCQPATGAAAN